MRSLSAVSSRPRRGGHACRPVRSSTALARPLLLFLLLGRGAAPLAAQALSGEPAATPPVYEVEKRTDLPEFERLTPGHFARAAALTLSEALTGGPASEKTAARLLWDDTALYACFEMEAADPAARSARHDADLWEGSVIELFIDPLGLGKVYYELEVNPKSAAFEALILNDSPAERRGPRFQIFREWNPASLRHRSAYSKARKEWVVLLAIDFADLFLSKGIPPEAGDVWRANVLRIDGLAPRQESYAWSPPRVPDFHNVRAFGTWRFVANAPARAQ